MDLGLAGRTVIVTGGASNIGRGIVLGFARERANIVIADLDTAQSQRTALDAEALGGYAVPVRADVCNSSEVEGLVQEALDQFGRIDVLVNNAAWTVQGALLLEKQEEEIHREISNAYWSALCCAKAVTLHMIDRKHGRIINLGSNLVRSGQAGAVVHSGNKAAIIGLTRALAKEMGRYNVTVNCVSPGLVLPEKPDDVGEGSYWHTLSKEVFTPDFVKKTVRGNPIRRAGKAEEIADMVVFLASDEASFITGQVIGVDGGAYLTE